ncbi:MAG: DUF3306 domain-containing protein [Betaproteobacteria bacterium]
MTRAAPENERFLSRWSRLKRAQGDTAETTPAESVAVKNPSGEVAAVAVPADAASATTSVRANGVDVPALPAIDTLTMDSDFTQFFQPKVPESLRRAAVKKLFADPHFNIMDGLDTYIDDYTKSDPIPPEMLAQLWNLRDIIDHPSNRKDEVGEAAEVAEVAEVEVAAPVLISDDAAAGTPSSISEEPAPSDLPFRPREGGDPATPFGDVAAATESHWVPAFAGTTAGVVTDSGPVPAFAGTTEIGETSPPDKPANSSA